MRFHNKLKSVDHWITSDGAGFMLVEGIFIPGTKARQVWFTVQSIIEKEATKVVYYIMKNGLIYKDDLWLIVLDYFETVTTNPVMDMLEKDEQIPDVTSSF